MDERLNIFNESGFGYWLDGFGCIRATGGFDDCNTTHAVVVEKDDNPVTVNAKGGICFALTQFGKYAEAFPILRASGGDVGMGGEGLILYPCTDKTQSILQEEK